jgi:glutaconate CoA-transferase, subunit A
MPNLTYIPHVKVDAICEAPWGAYPTSCDTVYDEDEREVRRWLDVSRDSGALRDYLDRFASHPGDHAALAEHLAGAGQLADLRVGG